MSERDWLYAGSVMHRRLRPVAHRFAYRVFFLRFPLSRIAELANPLFSLDSFNLFSFHRADHGDGGDPQAWIAALLAREGVADAGGEVVLQTFPRVLGHVFNPVSFWFCHNSEGALRAIVAEVNNTFGERHCYLLEAAAPAGQWRAIGRGTPLHARKVFHVSPFFAVEGGYRFRFAAAPANHESEARCVARIDYLDAAGDLLHTAISGRACAFDAPTLLRLWFTHPMMSFGLMLRIHWQALQLWRKRLPFHRKPAPPIQPVTRQCPD
jgi:hypothetical protein